MALQQAFTGLRKYLGFFGGGKLPAEWNQEITGTVNVDQFILPIRWSNNLPTIMNAIGQAYGCELAAQNEMLFVHALGIKTTAVVGAGQTIVMVPAVNPRNLNTWIPVDPNNHSINFAAATGAQSLLAKGLIFSRPLVLNPGDAVGFLTTSLIGAGNQVIGSAAVQRIQI